jgi:hypothetical protein
MTKFWSGLRETRRDRQALFPGKGRRFKSGQPHHPIGTVESYSFFINAKFQKSFFGVLLVVVSQRAVVNAYEKAKNLH